MCMKKQHVYDISQIDRTPKSQRKESKCFWRITSYKFWIRINLFLKRNLTPIFMFIYVLVMCVCDTPSYSFLQKSWNENCFVIYPPPFSNRTNFRNTYKILLQNFSYRYKVHAVISISFFDTAKVSAKSQVSKEGVIKLYFPPWRIHLPPTRLRRRMTMATKNSAQETRVSLVPISLSTSGTTAACPWMSIFSSVDCC